jgi:hypothetical protein
MTAKVILFLLQKLPQLIQSNVRCFFLEVFRISIVLVEFAVRAFREGAMP